MNLDLNIYCNDSIKKYCETRANETRIWQSLSFLDTNVEYSQALKDAADFGKKYVLIGIPEGLGPRANLGRGGAELGWQAFLSRFLNLQANRYFPGDKVLLLGEINTGKLMQEAEALDTSNATQLSKLRELCAQLDKIVEPVIQAIFDAGLEPLVIGGGHNNCFPIISALAKSKQSAVNAVNLDPHADFRDIEGRHSGNGFHYAYKNNYLAHYHIIGLHEYKNNEAIYNALAAANFNYDSYQKIKIRQEITLNQACENVNALMAKSTNPLGVEIDLDCISNMPVSAFTNCGFTINDAERFVHIFAKNAKYLHLCEAAPEHHPAGIKQGLNEAGQVISTLILTYLYAKESD